MDLFFLHLWFFLQQNISSFVLFSSFVGFFLHLWFFLICFLHLCFFLHLWVFFFICGFFFICEFFSSFVVFLHIMFSSFVVFPTFVFSPFVVVTTRTTIPPGATRTIQHLTVTLTFTNHWTHHLQDIVEKFFFITILIFKQPHIAPMKISALDYSLYFTMKRIRKIQACLNF